MDNFLKKKLEQAKSKRKQTKLFLKGLKKKNSAEVNSKAIEFHHEVFEEIDCLNCANCCKTTGPLFMERDIARLSKHLKMRPAEFIDQYLRIDEDQDYVLQSVPCPFLGTDNYCSVYEARPKACKEYPHTDFRDFKQITNLTYKNTMICPAAFAVVEKMQKHFENS